jgi:hypothetical protein
MKKITQTDVMELPFPTSASIGRQEIAVGTLDAIVDRVEELRSVESSTGRDLEALMPALLDRVLHGELLASGV